MFERINLMWAGLGKMDIVLMVLSCVAIGAVYAAFLL